jgi:hypothetical protein
VLGYRCIVVGVWEHVSTGVLEQAIKCILMDPELLSLIQHRHIRESIVA